MKIEDLKKMTPEQAYAFGRGGGTCLEIPQTRILDYVFSDCDIDYVCKIVTDDNDRSCVIVPMDPDGDNSLWISKQDTIELARFFQIKESDYGEG